MDGGYELTGSPHFTVCAEDAVAVEIGRDGRDGARRAMSADGVKGGVRGEDESGGDASSCRLEERLDAVPGVVAGDTEADDMPMSNALAEERLKRGGTCGRRIPPVLDASNGTGGGIPAEVAVVVARRGRRLEAEAKLRLLMLFVGLAVRLNWPRVGLRRASSII